MRYAEGALVKDTRSNEWRKMVVFAGVWIGVLLETFVCS